MNLIKYAKGNNLLGLWTEYMTEAGAIPGIYTIEANIMFNSRSILTADPENIKALLGPTQFADYGKGFKWRQAFDEFIGGSIFTVDGEPWHDLRQMMRPIFNKERVGDLRVFEKHIQKLMPHLGSGDGSEVNIRSLFLRYSMDIGVDFLLGTDIDSLNHPDGEVVKAWETVQETQALMVRTG